MGISRADALKWLCEMACNSAHVHAAQKIQDMLDERESRNPPRCECHECTGLRVYGQLWRIR